MSSGSKSSSAAATRRVNNNLTSHSSSKSIPSKETPPKKQVPPLRRSRSVSAFARSQQPPDVSSDFLVKRDNPLFWGTNSGAETETTETQVSDSVKISKFDDVTSKRAAATSRHVSNVDDNRRGRPLSRNPSFESNGLGNRNETGRSLSRVDTGRRFRSVSRPPVSSRSSVNSEGESEQESALSSKYPNNKSMSTTTTPSTARSNLVRGRSISSGLNEMKKGSLQRSNSGLFDKVKAASSVSSSVSAQPYRRNPTWEDELSVSSNSEVEENTSRAVFEPVRVLVDKLGDDASTSAIYETVRSEVRRAISDIQIDLEKAIRKSSASVISKKNVTDILPDLDIRSEYAQKLEQSNDRAKQLRADLAVEEHRKLELSKILKEELPDSKTPSTQKSRTSRKSSIERRKISNRLSEEAMAYFDECVSLSTFDSSDFSSTEDPLHNSAGMTTPYTGLNISAAHCPSSCLSSKQVKYDHDASEFSTNISTKNPTEDPVHANNNNAGWGDRKHRFSFSRGSTEAFELDHDIRKYVKNFEKEKDRADVNTQLVRSNHIDLEEYDNSKASQQSLLFDRVYFKNRLESGGLLLCNGGMANAFSPFVCL